MINIRLIELFLLFLEFHNLLRLFVHNNIWTSVPQSLTTWDRGRESVPRRVMYLSLTHHHTSIEMCKQHARRVLSFGMRQLDLRTDCSPPLMPRLRVFCGPGVFKWCGAWSQGWLCTCVLFIVPRIK